MREFKNLLLVILLLILSTNAYAYIGPGLGVGALATIFGLFLGMVMLLAGIIWYPIKKLIKKIRK